MRSKLFRTLCIFMTLTLAILTFTSCGKKDKYNKTDGVSQTDPTTAASEENSNIPANINPLTGLELSAEAIGKRPIAIMVENSPAARPQWGISTPDIVIEGLVEGGITRMMWIYADVSKVPKVGPVRSARHDYVEIAYGMNAVFAHWGGSPQAYTLISNLGYDDVDGKIIGTNGGESNKGYYFFKDNSHSSSTEHCGYTTGAYLAAAIEKKGINMTQTKSNYAPFTVVPNGNRTPNVNNETYGALGKAGECASITVTFSSSYKHTFKYDAEKGVYKNFMGTAPMNDGTTGEQMTVKNVIVMYCDTKSIDDYGRQDWNMTEGEALYVSNGYGEKISWKKGSESSPLKFYGVDGKELKVSAGQTWIGVVPKSNASLTTVEN